MRNTAKSMMLVVLTLISAVALGVVSVLTSAVTLAATGLIVPGTGTPDAEAVTGFMTSAQQHYLGATHCAADTDCTLKGVPYPASLWPLVGGLSGAKYGESVDDGVARLNAQLFDELRASNDPVVIFGFSQGSNVVSFELENLRYLDQVSKDRLSVVMTGNTQRPSGGIWTRLGLLEYIPILDIDLGRPTPNDIGIKIMDIAYEYDAVGDAPTYLFNPLTLMNSLCGLVYIHPTYIAPNGHTSPDALPDEYTPEELAKQLDPNLHPENFRYFGADATYVTIPTKTLPFMRPGLDLAAMIGLTPVVKPIIDLISPVFRVLIDLGYDRSINPGEYTPFKLIPIIDPLTLIGDLVGATFQGVNNAVSGITATVAPPASVAPPTVAASSQSPTQSTTPPPSTARSITADPDAETTSSRATATADAQSASEPDLGTSSRSPLSSRPLVKSGNLFRPGDTVDVQAPSHDTDEQSTTDDTTTPPDSVAGESPLGDAQPTTDNPTTPSVSGGSATDAATTTTGDPPPTADSSSAAAAA